MPRHNHRIKSTPIVEQTLPPEGHCCFEMAIHQVVRNLLVSMYELSGAPEMSGIYFPGSMTALEEIRIALTGTDRYEDERKFINVCEETLTWAKQLVGLEDLDLHASDGIAVDAEN